MKKILFDSSSHLGQFCISNEDVRKGCKNMQAGISTWEEFESAPLGEDKPIGAWTDLENGRTDKTMWNLSDKIQDNYYPIMDRFYSIMTIHQKALSGPEEEMALLVRHELPNLSLYSRYTCASAIVQRVDEVHTLFAELLTENVATYMSETGVRMVKPKATKEIPYADELLEQRYQSALKTFQLCNINLPANLADKRVVDLD